MKYAKIVFLWMFAFETSALADVVGTMNVHTALNGRKTTGLDSGQPVAVQVDFSRTQDGTYDISVWSRERQLDKITRVYVQQGKATQGPFTIYCPATDLQQNGPTSFQIFVQAVLDNGQKGGRVLIAEVAWEQGSIEDGQPGKKVEPRKVSCSAGSNLDSHATGSFFFQNQSGRSLKATLMFGGRKYKDYDLSGHGNQRVQADVWGVNPGVGWYVTTPNPYSAGGQEIEAAGPIYNTEGGSDSGFNKVELNSPDPSPTPTTGPSASPSFTANQGKK